MGEKSAPKFELLVAGSPVDPVLAESVSLLRVHQHLEMADALEVRLANDDLSWSEADTLAEGAVVALKLGYEGDAELLQVFQGEVARRDCEFPEQGAAVVTVVAYDKEHRLKRGRISRTWIDMTDSQVFAEIAGEVGLTADVEDSAVRHRFLFQTAQTNLSFIRERAALLDYIVDIDRENSAITFKKADETSSVASLAWGVDLLGFSCRMTTDEQVSKVVVRGWDMQAKTKLEGTAQASDVRYVLGGADKGVTLAEDTFGAREVLYTDRPVFVKAEADALAKARLNKLSARYVSGQAYCQGDPAIVAGAKVTVEAVGERAGGDYYVTKVLHHFEPGGGFSTHFDVLRSTERLTPGEDRPPPDPLPAREQEPAQAPSFVEIVVRADRGESLEGVSYEVEVPGQPTQSGTLDATHTIRIDGINEPGQAKITFTPPGELEAVGE